MASQKDLGFWEHVDELRGVLIRVIAAVLCCGILTFCFKEWLFDIVFMPAKISGAELTFINTELTRQFVVHVEMALWAGVVAVFPYILVELVRFISPALYDNEKRALRPIVVWGYLLFMMGIALNYFVIYPFTFRFLSEYQVTTDVANMISLDSYVGTLLMMSMVMGVTFELPVVCGILGRMGLLKSAWMKQYRKHAIVAILVVSAVITPTGDAFTLMLVSLPIYLLWEVSIWVVKRREFLFAKKNK